MSSPQPGEFVGASTSYAVQVAISHLALGILSGSILEALTPKYDAASSTAKRAFESFVQVGLNGVLLSMVGRSLTNGDPTYGIPFSMGLFASQVDLDLKLTALSAEVTHAVEKLVQKTVPPAPVAIPPNQGSAP
tara:strand:+ start:163 stop:564 length:402 start_codon:yes stop_codon:yes gene_type:complete